MAQQSRTRTAVLDALRNAFPGAVGPDALFALAGRPYPSRIGELRDQGWQIETGHEATPSYRLISMIQGTPTRILAGCILRLTDNRTEPWTSRTHSEARKSQAIEADALADAEQAAADAYRAVLRARGYAHLLDAHGPAQEAPGASCDDEYDEYDEDDIDDDDVDAYVARWRAIREED